MSINCWISGAHSYVYEEDPAATLAWASKYGLPEPTGLMLGQHEETGQSMACYSRDFRPLSHYQSMLMNVRRGFFLPDASRSASLSLRAQLEVLQKRIHRWRRLQDHGLQ